MKLRIAFFALVVGGAVGLLFQFGGASAVAGNESVVAATSFTLAGLTAGEHEFVGSKKCKMCHKERYTSWEETTHAKGFAILKPGERKEAKEKYQLDPAKDYTKDKSCLGCHTTGYEKTGGYAIPAEGDEKAAKTAAKLEGAGCESCHGAGKDYCQLKKEIKKAFKADGTKYKPEQLVEAGMTMIEAGTCTCCHNEKSPTYNESKKFDFEKMVKTKEAIHIHKPLEMKAG